MSTLATARGYAAAGMALAALLAAPPALSLDLQQCDRVTHPSYGGAADHVDRGQGWVSWTGWWSNEGVYTELNVADCAARRHAVVRLHQERITDRAFDRRRQGAEVFDRHLRRSAPLWSLDELVEQLADVGGDARLMAMTMETCGCAAAYPGARGDLPRFELN